ncbi:C40 family peptidase [Sporosarcina sp. YIM B06819]|uniref:C40 family peptidase n=1 Tax=Sporosarcina sp. YIM B06819 TaxID=3081769 RepID=UPI00298C4FDD|nr:C40 family peptidase [Sporosarcina sp. YIM B06819]
MTKSLLASFLAIIVVLTTIGSASATPLIPDNSQAKTCYKPNKSAMHIVNVQVTTLWKQPNVSRPADKPSLTSPTDLKKWATSMSINQKEWLIGKIDTQALYGQEVSVLKSSGDWHQVAVKDQYVPNNPSGYQGWVPKLHIKEVYSTSKDCRIAVVDAPIAKLYNAPKLSDKYHFMDISYTTILPVIQQDKDWLQVQTPSNGVKYLRQRDAKIFENYEAIPKPAQHDIVDNAMKFIGLPYLWAGTSGFGFDCSGIMHSVYKNHGILIPRDSSVQATKGTPVTKKNRQPGDLLFFAHNKGKGKVYHVGMYIGDGKMLHAPNSSRKVEVIPVDIGIYKTNYAGARRYLQ